MNASKLFTIKVFSMDRHNNGILLIILILFDTISVDYVYAQTEDTKTSVKESIVSENEVSIGNFNLNQYRADLYLKNDTVSNRIIQFMMEIQFPSRVVTDQFNGNKVFQNSVSAWKTVHFATSSSEIAKSGIDEKGYYTAIILSAFKAETNNDTYL
ncbi:MAG: hypothetical protein K1V96_08495 [Lachnospiraceae bacterium]